MNTKVKGKSACLRSALCITVSGVLFCCVNAFAAGQVTSDTRLVHEPCWMIALPEAYRHATARFQVRHQFCLFKKDARSQHLTHLHLVVPCLSCAVCWCAQLSSVDGHHPRMLLEAGATVNVAARVRNQTVTTRAIRHRESACPHTIRRACCLVNQRCTSEGTLHRFSSQQRWHSAVTPSRSGI